MDDSLKAFIKYVLETTGKIERMTQEQRVCGSCGITYNAFRSSGKLGCAICYDAFRNNISEVLADIHGSNEFKGKIPAGQTHKYSDLLIKRDLDENQRLLKRALEAEDFNLAATYRDAISDLMDKITTHEEGGVDL